MFSRPRTTELARLIGIETIVAGEITEIADGLAKVRVGSIELLAVPPSGSSRRVHVCIRGEDVALQKGQVLLTSVRNHLSATIQSLTPEGPLVRVRLNCGFEMTALITRPASNELQLAAGDQVTAMLKAPAIHLISRLHRYSETTRISTQSNCESISIYGCHDHTVPCRVQTCARLNKLWLAIRQTDLGCALSDAITHARFCSGRFQMSRGGAAFEVESPIRVTLFHTGLVSLDEAVTGLGKSNPASVTLAELLRLSDVLIQRLDQEATYGSRLR